MIILKFDLVTLLFRYSYLFSATLYFLVYVNNFQLAIIFLYLLAIYKTIIINVNKGDFYYVRMRMLMGRTVKLEIL